MAIDVVWLWRMNALYPLSELLRTWFPASFILKDMTTKGNCPEHLATHCLFLVIYQDAYYIVYLLYVEQHSKEEEKDN